MRLLSLIFPIFLALSFADLFGFGREKIGISANSLSFSPDGQYLLFSIYQKGSWQIYRLKKDGTELTQLTSGPGRHMNAQYSPDGSKIAFSYSSSLEPNSQRDLFLMNADSSNRVQLTTGPADDSFPTFSPDGQRIYFLRSRWFGKYSPFARATWHEKDIYSIRIDGTDFRQITDGSYYGMGVPSISPDGTRIVANFEDEETQQGGLWIFPIENPESKKRVIPPELERFRRDSEEKRLSSDLWEDMGSPSFSPRGGVILFKWLADAKGLFKYELYLTDLETGETKEITRLGSYLSAPTFSRDGKEIAFFSDPKRNNESYELWIVNSDGTDLRRVPLDLDEFFQRRTGVSR